tara:strand:+ start:243 stop:779 length:537 start_codon:yes stop_codon:yes gene_type:complete
MDTIFEIDEIDTPQPETIEEEKPKKKEPKIKKKKEMSEERKQKLREQLSRGRKTLADKRAKKKAEPKKEKSQQEEKVATRNEKSQQEPKVENIKMEVKKNNNDDLRNEISELKKLILEGRQPKEPKVEPIQAKAVEKPKEKLIQVLETPKLISAPIPIPQKKKRSLLGGGMVLNLSRF